MKKRILIVDDETNILITLADILNTIGYEAETVDNGSGALKLIDDQLFDVILMDFKMADANGVEIFREIHKSQPEIKVIFITAYYHEQSVQEAIDEGAVAVCHKPLDITNLLKLIQSVA